MAFCVTMCIRSTAAKILSDVLMLQQWLCLMSSPNLTPNLRSENPSNSCPNELSISCTDCCPVPTARLWPCTADLPWWLVCVFRGLALEMSSEGDIQS